ncbi:exodeoxyribonuclease I [Arenimonas soli]|uniref:Exodeoxyribonuclease I n=1 Tax=Arenimonas soli TaxID=2269504 RepID=A0ABQ1HHH5_9GAMM|nr:exodeoxyribonuclease I [Arenimonas soli]GGA76360.1 exodeoxyribonuclease I [Arenimonas soli]
MTASFLWYDLETFGRDPRRTRIAQFAAQRTDADLNPVGEPLSLFCQPADDLLPSPEATMITGITPQHALAEGLREAEFMARLHEEFAKPGTCAVGYNSIRFDDEFVRFGLYRNFHDPYEREWRSGNSRWDLLDVLRLAEALRPEGLEWPRREDGAPSFKLEHLALVNGVREGDAHEALSDVRALIGLARKFKAAQPRLWDYAFSLRNKRQVGGLLDVANMTPLLHISSRYPASRHCAALVAPIARHPRIESRVIVASLDEDPTRWLDMSPEDIAERLFVREADLPEGEHRIPLKEVHTNKCPVLLPLAHLRGTDFERLGIDRAASLAHADTLRATPGLGERVRRAFAVEAAREPADADAALYDGFPAEGDKRLFPKVRSTAPAGLAALAGQFTDPRYGELLFRYRARNWPDSLDADERERWDLYRRTRLGGGDGLSEYDFTSYYAAIARLRADNPPGPKQAWLDALDAWGHDIQRSLA